MTDEEPTVDALISRLCADTNSSPSLSLPALLHSPLLALIDQSALALDDLRSMPIPLIQHLMKAALQTLTKEQQATFVPRMDEMVDDFAQAIRRAC